MGRIIPYIMGKNVPDHQPESHEDTIQIPFKSWQLRLALS